MGDKSTNTERYVIKAVVEIDGEEKTVFFSPLVKSKGRAQEFVALRVKRNGNKLIKFLE